MNQELFDYLHETFGITPLGSEMDEIIRIVLCNQSYCTHPAEYRRVRVLNAAVNCETTAEFCGACGKRLTEPTTDC